MPLRDLKISELCSVSQAADPIPGSGGISAVIGMLAASMAETVARLTMERQEAPTPEMVEAVRELHALRMDLLDAADRDEAAMAELRGSEQMPAGGDMEREFRDRRLSRAGKAAVEVPVYTARERLEVPVEVQIRTIAMDFWASLEHQLRYKTSSHVPDYLKEELRELAGTIADTDLRMQDIYQQINDL